MSSLFYQSVQNLNPFLTRIESHLGIIFKNILFKNLKYLCVIFSGTVRFMGNGLKDINVQLIGPQIIENQLLTFVQMLAILLKIWIFAALMKHMEFQLL